MSSEHSPGCGRTYSPTAKVLARFGWSRTTLWRRIKAGQFPAPYKTGPHSNSFCDQEMDEHAANLERVDYAPNPDGDQPVPA